MKSNLRNKIFLFSDWFDVNPPTNKGLIVWRLIMILESVFIFNFVRALDCETSMQWVISLGWAASVSEV